MKIIGIASLVLSLGLIQAVTANASGRPNHHRKSRVMSCFATDSQEKYFRVSSFRRNTLILQEAALNRCLERSEFPNSCRNLGCHITSR